MTASSRMSTPGNKIKKQKRKNYKETKQRKSLQTPNKENSSQTNQLQIAISLFLIDWLINPNFSSTHK